MRANVACLLGALAMVGTACGKSANNGSDGAGNGGAGMSAAAGAGGRGGTELVSKNF